MTNRREDRPRRQPDDASPSTGEPGKVKSGGHNEETAEPVETTPAEAIDKGRDEAPKGIP